MDAQSPFTPPRVDADVVTPPVHPVGPVRAVLGLFVCVYAVGVLGLAGYTLLMADGQTETVLAIFLAVVGVPSFVGGWRWTERRRAWPWLLGPALLHLLVVLLWLASQLDG